MKCLFHRWQLLFDVTGTLYRLMRAQESTLLAIKHDTICRAGISGGCHVSAKACFEIGTPAESETIPPIMAEADIRIGLLDVAWGPMIAFKSSLRAQHFDWEKPAQRLKWAVDR